MRTILLALLIVVMVVSVFCLSGWIIMLIWGALAKYFGFRTITFGMSLLIALVLLVATEVFGNRR